MHTFQLPPKTSETIKPKTDIQPPATPVILHTFLRRLLAKNLFKKINPFSDALQTPLQHPSLQKRQPPAPPSTDQKKNYSRKP